MKPRVRHTIKILAVAATAAGCTSAVAPKVEPEHAQRVDSPDPSQAALAPLVAELEAVGLQNGLTHMGHFRPLCDERGYPLVGNVRQKGMPPPSVSKLCDEVRKQAKP